MAEPGADMDALMNKMDRLQTQIEAADGWELERQLERAMDALRCPPGNPPPRLVFPDSAGNARKIHVGDKALQIMLEQGERLELPSDAGCQLTMQGSGGQAGRVDVQGGHRII